MAQRSAWIGLGFSSALALVVAAGCGGGSSPTPVDGGRDTKPAQDAPTTPTDGGKDTDMAARKDAAPDQARHDATVEDAAHDAGSKDAPAADALPPGCETGPQGEPTDLRCTGLYSDWASKTVASNVRQYDPGLRLWSDGAGKTRWIYLPPGTQINTSDMDEWTFPPGTKLWKEFVVGGARLETRLIWKRPNGNWYFTTYRWATDESSAPHQHGPIAPPCFIPVLAPPIGHSW